jgi:hypothetical protein
VKAPASELMKRHAAPIFAALMVLLPVLYVGTYLALVKPGLTISYGNRPPSPYRCGGELAETFFWPLEQIDRRLRPSAWSSLADMAGSGLESK